MTYQTDGKPWEGPLHRVSPHNFSAEVTAQYQFREPLTILDATIAKMDHLEASRLYSVEEYLEIVALLVEAGITEISIHTGVYPGTSKEERIWEALRAIAEAHSNLKIRVFDIAWPLGKYRERFDELADAGADALIIVEALSGLPPVTHQDLADQAEMAQRMRELPKAFAYARKLGLEVGMGTPPAALRDDIETTVEALNTYIEWGAQGFELSESQGFASPDSISYFMRTVRQGLSVDVPIWYHNHDVFGLATAQAIACASGGGIPQASVNGVADRGFPSLEAVAVSLELLYGVPTGIKLDKLPQLSRAVERITGVSNPPYKAVVGERLNIPDYPERYLAHLQKKGLVETRTAPFEMELVGRKQQLGMFYGVLNAATVKAILEDMGLPDNADNVTAAMDGLKRGLDALGNKYPVLLNHAEVEKICREIVAH